MNVSEQLDAAGVGIAHHFVGGLYAKETHIPAGVTLTQHSHAFDHLSALMKGSAVVEVDGREKLHYAPALLTIKARKVHSVRAVTDVFWVCLHATDETDPVKVDAELTA